MKQFALASCSQELQTPAYVAATENGEKDFAKNHKGGTK